MKKETLEEVAEILIFKTIGGNYGLASSDEHDQVDGYFDTYLEAFLTLKLKWQQERSYSEEEVLEFGKYLLELSNSAISKRTNIKMLDLEVGKKLVKDLFEQFKNK
jgi:hypothetical protein